MKTEFTMQEMSRKQGIGRMVDARRREVCRVLAALYGAVLEEEVSPERAARIAHAQVAFVALMLCGAASLLCSAACVAWFVAALLRCRGE